MNTNSNVPENVHQFKKVYKELVKQLVTIRNQADLTQASMAEWLGVDRRKIIQFEGIKKVNLELLLLYGDKLSVDVKFKYQIN